MIAKNVKTRRDYLKQHSSAQGIFYSGLLQNNLFMKCKKNNVSLFILLNWFVFLSVHKNSRYKI